MIELLEANECRGYTLWNEVAGRGGVDGEPHEGTHAWPTLNNAILAFVEDDKVESILEGVRHKDEESPDLGMRAFVWTIGSYPSILSSKLNLMLYLRLAFY